jgi:hypothetical protein
MTLSKSRQCFPNLVLFSKLALSHKLSLHKPILYTSLCNKDTLSLIYMRKTVICIYYVVNGLFFITAAQNIFIIISEPKLSYIIQYFGFVLEKSIIRRPRQKPKYHIGTVPLMIFMVFYKERPFVPGQLYLLINNLS